MKNTIYPRLALSSVKKNKRLYTPYICTCIGMVTMFYIISYLSLSEAVKSFTGSTALTLILNLGNIVIGVFSLEFLFYTNSFLVRRRKKEFGLYNILGMGKANLAIVLIWESLIISAVSILSGLLCGILFSKLSELLMVKILRGSAGFQWTVDWNAVKNTVILFAVIFVLLLINTLRQIAVSRPVELLKSENTGEKPPKANWLLAVFGIVLLAAAYGIALTVETSVEAIFWFFGAVIMVMAATYMLFVAGSVSICRLLQKNKKYYYKANHFISVSSMSYRMKRNGAGLASICILCTMVLVMVSSTVCLYAGAEDSLRRRYPRDISLDFNLSRMSDFNSDTVGELEDTALKTAIENEQIPENIMSYRSAQFTANVEDDKAVPADLSVTSFSTTTSLFLVPLEDYNEAMGKNEKLGKNEALVYCENRKFGYPQIKIGDFKLYKVKENLSEFMGNPEAAMNVMPSMFVVVPDFEGIAQTLDDVADYKGDKLLSFNKYYGFDLATGDELQIELGNILLEKLESKGAENKNVTFSAEISARERVDFYSLYGGLFFLGIVLGIVFISANVLMIYYKQLSEGYEDRSRFEIMQKVGMNKKEIKKSINSQILTVFFMPLVMSAVHLAFAMPMIYKILFMLSGARIGFLVSVTLLCLAVFALFYVVIYVITSRTYYSIVSKD